jgi:hypothetical protein
VTASPFPPTCHHCLALQPRHHCGGVALQQVTMAQLATLQHQNRQQQQGM